MATRNANAFLSESLKKTPLESPKPRWEDDIRMDHREIVWEDVDWIHLAQDRYQWRALVNSIITLRDPQRWRISYLVVQFSTTEEH
jgi:hypothetical protein